MKKYVSLLLAAVITVAGLGLISTPAHADEGAVLTVERVGASVRFDLTGAPANEQLRYMTTVWGEENVDDLTTDAEGSATVIVALPADPTSDVVSMVVARTVPVFEPIASVSTTIDPADVPADVPVADLTITQRIDDDGRQFVVTGAEPGETVTYKIVPSSGGVEPIIRTAVADATGRAVLPFASYERVTVTVFSPTGQGGPVAPLVVMGLPSLSVNSWSEVEYASRGKVSAPLWERDCTVSAYKTRGFRYPGGIVTGLSAGQVLPLIEHAYGKSRVVGTVEADQSGRAVIPAITLSKVNTSGRWVDGRAEYLRGGGPAKLWQADLRDPMLTLGSMQPTPGEQLVGGWVTLAQPFVVGPSGLAANNNVHCNPPKHPAVNRQVEVRVGNTGKIAVSVSAWAWSRVSTHRMGWEAVRVKSGMVKVKNAKGKTVVSKRIASGSSPTFFKVKRPGAGRAVAYRVSVKTISGTFEKKVKVAGIPKVTAKAKGKRVVAKIRYANRPLAKGSKVTVKVAGQKPKKVTVRKAGVVSVKAKVKGKKKVRFVVRDANGKRLGKVVKEVKR